MPSCTIKQQDGVRSFGDHGRDFVEMHLHGIGADERQGEGCADTSLRADRPKQVGVVVALVGRLSWPRAPPGPLPDDTVLLPDACFVLEPDLDPTALRQMAGMSSQRCGEVFLNASMIAGD